MLQEVHAGVGGQCAGVESDRQPHMRINFMCLQVWLDDCVWVEEELE